MVAGSHSQPILPALTHLARRCCGGHLELNLSWKVVRNMPWRGARPLIITFIVVQLQQRFEGRKPFRSSHIRMFLMFVPRRYGNSSCSGSGTPGGGAVVQYRGGRPQEESILFQGRVVQRINTAVLKKREKHGRYPPKSYVLKSLIDCVCKHWEHFSFSVSVLYDFCLFHANKTNVNFQNKRC